MIVMRGRDPRIFFPLSQKKTPGASPGVTSKIAKELAPYASTSTDTGRESAPSR